MNCISTTYVYSDHVITLIILCDIVSGAISDLMVIPAERSAQLTASPPNITNGIITSYNVSYRVNGSSNVKVENFTTNNQFLSDTVQPLLPFTTYVFSVSACTVAGCGPSTSETSMTLEDGELMLCNVHSVI